MSSLSKRHGKATECATELAAAFGLDVDPIAAANSMFPAVGRHEVQSYKEAVDKAIDKIRSKAPTKARSILAEVTELRKSALPADQVVYTFVQCRKSSLFRMGPNEIAASSPFSSRGSNGNMAPSTSSNISGSSSPFMRRSASRDPIHRDKIKDEPITPLSAGSSNASRIRMNHPRSQSNMGVTEYNGISMEKQHFSYSNPMYHESSEDSANRRRLVTPTSFKYQYDLPTPTQRHLPTVQPEAPRSAPVPAQRGDPPAYSSVKQKPLGARMGFPPTICLDELCYELRGALQGVCGKYFVEDGRGNMIRSKGLSARTDLIRGIDDVLSAANVYRLLETESRRTESDLTKKAMLGGIARCLEVYLNDVQKLKLQDVGTKRLFSIIYKAREWDMPLSFLRNLVHLKSLSALELLEELYDAWLTARYSVCENVARQVLDRAITPLRNALCSWLTTGTLPTQAYTDFIISGSKEDGYKCTFTPKFLPIVDLEEVVSVGSCMCYVSDAERPALDALKQVVHNKITPSHLYDLDKQRMLAEVVQSMAKTVGQSVIRCLQNESYLKDHLRAVRTYLLLDDTCFAEALHRKILEYTGGLKSTISQKDVSSAFVWAIARSPRTFPFKVMLDTLVTMHDSPNTSSRLQYVQPLRPIYKVTGIASAVFKNTTERYDVLFHFIWGVQMGLFTIADVGNGVRILQREICAESGYSMKNFNRLLMFIISRCHRIILAVRQYIFSIVETLSARLYANLDSVKNIEMATEYHHTFLANLSSSLFCAGTVSDEEISGLIATILEFANDLMKMFVGFERDLVKMREGTGSGLHGQDPTETVRDFTREEWNVALSEHMARLKIIDAGLRRASSQLAEAVRKQSDARPWLRVLLIS